MEVLEQFEEYLIEWSHKKHVPKPTKNTNKEMWSLAWQDFVTEVLAPNYQQMNNQYKDMKLMTYGERIAKSLRQYNGEEVEESNSGVEIPGLDPIDLEAENIDYNELIAASENSEEDATEPTSESQETPHAESDWDVVQQYLDELK